MPGGAVYVGNYEYDATERELERTFEKYGEVERVEYKSGAPISSPLPIGLTAARQRACPTLTDVATAAPARAVLAPPVVSLVPLLPP